MRKIGKIIQMQPMRQECLQRALRSNKWGMRGTRRDKDLERDDNPNELKRLMHYPLNQDCHVEKDGSDRENGTKARWNRIQERGYADNEKKRSPHKDEGGFNLRHRRSHL